MLDWSPLAIVPNIRLKQGIDGDVIAIARHDDVRVQQFGGLHPALDRLLGKFTDAFGVPLRPALMIGRDDVLPKLTATRAAASFRDLVSMCVVPYGRALNIVYSTNPRIIYSNWLWLYPWMLGADNEHLVASTPAFRGLHMVNKFQGQSSPELPTIELNDFDEPLFQALLPKWKRHYLTDRQSWHDRALFRSLNMANQAAQLPAGIDTTIYDLGRMIALWVSACEILAHPRIGQSTAERVYGLLEKVSYLDRNVARRSYVARTSTAKKNKKGKRRSKPKMPIRRRPLPSWLYGRLNEARNNFLHGNRLSARALQTRGSSESLFMLAAPLYRLALTGFLEMSRGPSLPKDRNALLDSAYVMARLELSDYQGVIERALLRSRK